MLSAAPFIAISCLAALGLATPVELQPRGCANNCARAVIANGFPSRPTKADCSFYLAVTVTPSTLTFTATATNTRTETATRVLSETKTDSVTEAKVATARVTNTVTAPVVEPVKRQAAAKTIPTYASSCKDNAAYVEACSCIGVFAYTVTAPAPSTTVPATVVQTLSETAVVTETTTITHTFLEATQTTITVETTFTPVPSQVVVNGRFTAPLNQPWKNSNTGQSITPSLEPINEGQAAGEPNYLRLVYPQTGDNDNVVNSGFYLTQRVRVEPNTEYELSYRWKYNNGQAGYCATFLFFTPQTNQDFPGGHPDYPNTGAAQTSAAGSNIWEPRQGRITTGPEVNAGTVAFVLNCQYSYSREMVVLVDAIRMTKVAGAVTGV